MRGYDPEMIYNFLDVGLRQIGDTNNYVRSAIKPRFSGTIIELIPNEQGVYFFLFQPQPFFVISHSAPKTTF